MGQRRYDGIRIRLQWRAEPDADPDPIAYADANTYSGTHTNADSKTYADAHSYADTRTTDGIADLDVVRWCTGEPLKYRELCQAQQSRQYDGDDQLGQTDGGYRLRDRVVNLQGRQNVGQRCVVHGRSEIHSTQQRDEGGHLADQRQRD